MASLTLDYLTRLTVDARQLGSIRRLGEARGRQDLFLQQATGQLEALRHVAMIESSESFSRIEGAAAGPGRVLELVLKRVPPRDRAEQAIAGYRDALQLIHESHAVIPFTSHVLLQFHRMLSRYLPDQGGRWKSADHAIAIEALVTGYRRAREAREADALVLMPLAVLDMLRVHPFRDGNGRIARLLTLLLLYRDNYRVGRYVSLERIVEGSKGTYDEALERSSRGWHEDRHDARPWLTYFWGVLIRAYDEFEARIETLKGSKTQQVRDTVLRRVAPFPISEIERDCPGVSRDMVRHVLRQLKSEGSIAPTGRGRGAKWQRTL